MKKILLLCIITMSFFAGYAQTLTNPPSTSSGTAILITGSGESSASHWTSFQSESITAVTPSGGLYYVTVTAGAQTFYNASTGAPSTLSLTFTNHSSSSLSVSFNVVVQGNTGGPHTIPLTVTVAAPTGTLYYNTQTSTGTTRNNCGAGYTGGYVLNTVPANSVISTISQSDANYQAFLIASAGAQANANAYGTCTPNITYSFSVSSFNTTATYFNLSVNGTNISGATSVVEFSPVVVNDTNPINNSSTVVVNVISGHVPTTAILEGPFTAIYGTISGSTITFTNVPLANGVGTGCGLLFY